MNKKIIAVLVSVYSAIVILGSLFDMWTDQKISFLDNSLKIHFSFLLVAILGVYQLSIVRLYRNS